MIKMTVRGMTEIKSKIDKIPRGARADAVQSAAKALIGNQAVGLQKYPPTRPGQTYRRTFNLRFGWSVTDWGDRTKLKIINAVPYVPYVQGDAEQAWMHKGRWRTISKVIEDNTAAMMRAVDQAVARYLKKIGL